MRISQAEVTTITHFSHPHPLQLTNLQSQQTLASCSGCKLTATGLLYCCNTCNYFLHIDCSKMPQKITHPFHKEHAFCLITKPRYPDGCFNCDACGKDGNGFSYHCKICSIDLHILCAAMPLSFTHQSHNHQLNLIFSPPYSDRSFNCDICNTPGSNHWLYRCHSCGFDVHLNCKNVPTVPKKEANFQGQATFGAAPMPQAAQMPQPQMASTSAPPPQSQVFGTFCSQNPATGVPLSNFIPNMTQMNQSFPQSPLMSFGPRQNINDLMALQMIQTLANSQNSLNQQYLQALLAGGGVGGGIGGLGFGGGVGGLSGGGAGGLGGLQYILQGMNGGGGLGGLGGGGIPGLGDGHNILQSLISGGAGGGGIPGLGDGHNILQSLISGGAGGGGGLDILQGLIGGGSGLDVFGGLGGLLGGEFGF